ncbi:hypothetical protein H2248_005764 [Termitomyces sp. 'cryptogamus']|nr:hypothetical protein H2248_005764 [Termitomyces sp. 'cryptogamus']
MAHVQPADAGIIRNFKAHYHVHFVNCAIDCYNSGITPADIYNINILKAMQITDIAWKEVHTTTIRNCWRKTRILPDSLLNPTSGSDVIPTVPISSLLNKDPIEAVLNRDGQKITESLSHLAEIGVLQPQNWMSLTELLNLVDENLMHNGGGEEEIFRAVLERQEAEEITDQNGGDDDLSIKVNEKPARRDALQAVSTLQGYAADIDGEFAREFEVMLNKFGRQTRLDALHTLEPTMITDYFAPKSS